MCHKGDGLHIYWEGEGGSPLNKASNRKIHWVKVDETIATANRLVTVQFVCYKSQALMGH